MFISEVFHSIQGEGALAGLPSVFVRTSGCNLRCKFCDTPYTSWNPEGSHQSLEQLEAQIKSFGCNRLVITGGEPLLAPEIEALCSSMKRQGFHITIETAATIFKPIEADLISLSPKLSNSTPDDPKWQAKHDQLRIQPDVIQQYLKGYTCQFKFVIDEPADIEEVNTLLSQLGYHDIQNIFLMPQATDSTTLHSKGRWIAELCKTHGYRFGPRLHIDLWGHTRGT